MAYNLFIMSKKKTKTRVEKELTRHNLDHIAKNTIVVKAEKSAIVAKSNKNSLSPQDAYIRKDLKNTIITIAIFVSLVAALGVITYTTGLLKPVLSIWNISY